MPIDYQIEPGLSAAELAEVFIRSTINRPVDDLPRLGQMIEKASLIITARDGKKLVGVARSLSDFCFATYLSDLAVDQAYQRQGIGKELVRRTREAIGEQTILLLIAAPAAKDYYAKIGFEKNGSCVDHRSQRIRVSESRTRFSDRPGGPRGGRAQFLTAPSGSTVLPYTSFNTCASPV